MLIFVPYVTLQGESCKLTAAGPSSMTDRHLFVFGNRKKKGEKFHANQLRPDHMNAGEIISSTRDYRANRLEDECIASFIENIARPKLKTLQLASYN
ncbi:hypothetical protein OUZ56_015171 [Daphnia magna]|uniref:Uncharacterized protein n=1 Tax=Daphnia magna TaxID=35525 RepID=A0ABR0AM10_9CRUS|nr:hypothetical protein OUZ56_015171 [Daphnia magna]